MAEAVSKPRYRQTSYLSTGENANESELVAHFNRQKALDFV